MMVRWLQPVGVLIASACLGLCVTVVVFSVGIGVTAVTCRLTASPRIPDPTNELDGLEGLAESLFPVACASVLSLAVALPCGWIAAVRAARQFRAEPIARPRGVQLYHTAGGRLTCVLPGVLNAEFRLVCHDLADVMGLSPVGVPTVAQYRAAWEFRRDDVTVAFDWHDGVGLLVAAKTPAAEQVIELIAQRLTADRSDAAAAGL